MKTRSAPIVVLALAFALSGLACPGPSPEPLDHGGDIPDTSDGISPVAEKCLSCHLGIEDAHPKLALSCTNCHGGDPEATTKEAAHTALPEPSVDLKKLATDQLDVLAETHPGALLFINPGDLRVASRGCGASNPAAGGGGCHQTIVETASRSVMQTFTGHYNMPRFLAGMQERAAVYGVVEVEDPDYDPSIPLSVPSLTPLRTPDPSAPAGATATIIDQYLPQKCPSCHTASWGKNNTPGDYRSSGCTACHMVYAEDGTSQSGDPQITKNLPSHPIKHELTLAIPTGQCEHCHYQGARIGLAYQGIREGGFDDKPEFAQPLGRSIHSHGADFYFVDEDTTNSVDETPPDIHFERGMHCADCHTSREVHGDGHIYSTAKGQLDIHCRDCHGTVDAPIEESADGTFRTSNGTELTQVFRGTDDKLYLRGRVDEAIHPMVQISESINAPENTYMKLAMGRDPVTNFSHTDTMECWTCHTSWRLSCFGCHVRQDDRLPGRDLQTGELTTGLVRADRSFWTIDLLVLGQNGRGMIDTMCASMQMFLHYKDENGDDLVTKRCRETATGKVGFGWMPNNAHTIRREAQPCTRCHMDASSSNAEAVRATYGFGAAWLGFTETDDQGNIYDLTRMLDDSGVPLSEFPHEGSGPVPLEIIDKVLQPGSHQN